MDGKRPSVSSLRGIVAAGHPQAAQAGAAILRAGGNAFDASGATAAALNVVEPYMSGLAGMGMATCYIAAEDACARWITSPVCHPSFPPDASRRREELARGRSPAARQAISRAGANWCAATARSHWPRCSRRRSALAKRGLSAGRIQCRAIIDTVAEFKGRHPFYDDWARSLHRWRAGQIGQRVAAARPGTNL